MVIEVFALIFFLFGAISIIRLFCTYIQKEETLTRRTNCSLLQVWAVIAFPQKELLRKPAGTRNVALGYIDTVISEKEKHSLLCRTHSEKDRDHSSIGSLEKASKASRELKRLISG